MRLRKTWSILDTADEAPEIMQLAQELEENPAQAGAERARRWRPWALPTLAAAAAIAVLASVVFVGERTAATHLHPLDHGSYQVVPSAAQRLALADGSLVELNAGGAVEPAFSASERRVRLVRGEAHFTVMKDPARPFIVEIGDVAVRAVGTAFNIRLARGAVEVLVTEGKVRVDDAAKGASLLPHHDAASTEPPVLAAGHRIVVPTEAPAPTVPVAVTTAEIERVLGWQGTHLVFQRTPLEEAIAAFNSFNHRQLVLGDPRLRTRRLGGSFRADNVDAFVRLLETGFDIRAHPRGENEIVLLPAK
jgi:transmembrane sensor